MVGRRRDRLLAVAIAGFVALATAGCAGEADDRVAARASHFYDAIAEGDAGAACADLAPGARSAVESEEGKPCVAVILDLPLPDPRGTGTVRRYGSMAQVVHPGETAFLSRYDGRWLLAAVGCPPVTGGLPHTCVVEVD